MASGPKYQPAPTRDSFEEPQHYTQPPPGYGYHANYSQGPSGSGPGPQGQYHQGPGYGATAYGPGVAAEPGFGPGYAPREEDDNVPDDFKYGGTVAEASPEIRMAFIRKVYTILTVQLLATTGFSVLSFQSTGYRNWIQTHTWMMWVSLIGAIVFMLLTFWKRKSYPMNMAFLSGFTALEAYSIGTVTSFYESRIVIQALLITLGIFLFLTVFAMQSKYDFTAWQPYLMGALWILILFGLISAFFPGGKTMDLIYGGVAALIFSGYILVDTQLVMRHYHVEEEIAAAISLYLDVLNLFLAILRILNSQSDN